ncbi:MAG: hypothetical protein U5K77_03120 [Candidatus Saccharibacteria bacterium]|nr:hypothetical protein [Candidatus Saccharibacteria bacterium]
MDSNKDNDNGELSTLEDQGTVTQSTQNAQPDPNSSQPPADQPQQPKKKRKLTERIQGAISRINIYLLFFILVVVVSGLIVFVSFQRQSQEDSDTTFDGQPLTQEELQQIRDSETTIGDAQHTLNIESNADFKGSVLVRDSLDVAGTIRVGGSLSLPGITVSGTSSFEQIRSEPTFHCR